LCKRRVKEASLYLKKNAADAERKRVKGYDVG
jgi:hypothetical protein